MEILDWMPEKDVYLKSKEVDIHDQFHNHLASGEITEKKLFGTSNRKFRIQSLNEAIAEAGIKITGKVLEVGAGDAWCSAYVAKNFDIDKIYTMEINRPAVEKLIPKVFDVVGVDKSKTATVLGTFNNIPVENEFDVILAMGALHHSSSLYHTFSNLYKALKPGGWLLAQEPYMVNTTPNDFYSKRDAQEVSFKGILEVKNADRTDVFYRECEYRVAAFHANFMYQSKRVVKEHEYEVKRWGKKVPVAEHTDKPNNLIIFAQKPLSNTDELPVTQWEKPPVDKFS